MSSNNYFKNRIHNYFQTLIKEFRYKFIIVNFIVINFIVDVLYSVLDPRVRLESKS